MALTTMDQLVAGLAASTKLRFYKATLSNTTAGQLHSLWRATGYPTQPAIPTTAEYLIHTATGAWPLPSGNSKYLAKLSASCSVANQLLIFDRMMQFGGLSGTVTTAQSTTGMTLTSPSGASRCNADGSDVLWCLEWYTDTGSTAVTATISYTDENNNSGVTTTVSLAATRRASTLLPILPNNTLSIKSIQSVQLSASTLTNGNFGVTALKRIAEVPLPIVGVGAIADYADLALPLLQGTECLQLAVSAGTTTTGNLTGSMEVIVTT